MKAREIIPGWPRGRSTSMPSRYVVIPESVYWVTARIGWGEYGRYQDYMGHLAEERRKAAMMEVHYEMQRIEARGSLRPQTADERMLFYFPFPLGIAPELIDYKDQLRKQIEALSGLAEDHGR